MASQEDRFWEKVPMREWSSEQWESLCDGCGKCCLHKLEDEDTHEIFLTDVACRYLDSDNCRCTVYSNRFRHVPDCVDISLSRPEVFQWLPNSCAYRLVEQGLPLPSWHHLIAGSKEQMHNNHMSVRDKVISELKVTQDDLESRIISRVT